VDCSWNFCAGLFSFLDQELISYRYCTHFVVLLLVGVLYKKAQGPVVSNPSEMKFGRIVDKVWA